MIPHWRRKFITLWTGQAFSILSSAISQYALTWYLTEKTGSTAVLSLSMMAIMLPIALLSPFTGSFSDRFDRRLIMVISDGAIGLVSLFLVILSAQGKLTLGPILVVMLLRSIGSSFHSPCLQAVTPLLAPPDSLAKCAGWSQGIQTVSMLLSPALAATLYASIPLYWILLLDSAGAIFAIVGLLAAQLPVLRVGKVGQKLRLWHDTRDGLRVLRSHTWLWQLCLVFGLFSMAFMPVSALFPLMSMGYFGRDAGAAAVVETVFSAGMLAGSIVLGVWGGTKNKMVAMVAAILALGALLALCGLLPPSAFWTFAILSGLMGVAVPFFGSLFMALLQEKVAPEYLGRVLGLSDSVMGLAAPLGLLPAALFGDYTGPSFWFLLAGILIIASGMLILSLPAVRDCDRP